MIDLVVGHLLDPFRSGVARFNALLAERLGVPVAGMRDGRVRSASMPLLSCKLSELDAAARDAACRVGPPLRLFLHEIFEGPLERRLVERADLVLCGNAEVLAHVERLGGRAREAFVPGMITDMRAVDPPALSVFSFGMAHKVRTDMFGRLRELLQSDGRPYALYVSHANHEAATAEDEESLALEVQRLFPERLFYLGNLSDVAIYNAIRHTMFFAAFFRSGVRANNTSVAAAMEAGAVVITNLDRYSPADLAHGETVLDITRLDALPRDDAQLRAIGERARAAAGRRSWAQLLEVASS